MSPRGKIVVWSVAVAVVLAGLAAATRLWPNMDFEDYGALGVGFVVVGGSIWASLYFVRRARDARARRVEALDRAMRSVADQTGDVYSPGGSYEQPMIQRIEYPGRLRGSRGAFSIEVFVSEDEDGYDLRVAVGPIAGRSTRLTAHSPNLSPAAQLQVKALLAQCDRVSIEQPPARRGQQPEPSRLICGTGSSKLDALLTAQALHGLIERSVSLARELPRAP